MNIELVRAYFRRIEFGKSPATNAQAAKTAVRRRNCKGIGGFHGTLGPPQSASGARMAGSVQLYYWLYYIDFFHDAE